MSDYQPNSQKKTPRTVNTEQEIDDKNDDKTFHLPATRRSVLKGMATVGPAVGVVGSNAAVGSAAADSEDNTSVSVASPDGTIEAAIEPCQTNAFGDDLPSGQIMSLSVTRDGTAVLEPSPLGITTYMGQFVTGLSLESWDTETVTKHYETVGGAESGKQILTACLATLEFRAEAGIMHLDLLVSNEGVAYRYRLPGDGHVIVDKEISAFHIPEESPAWLMPFSVNYENIWRETDAETASGNFNFPCLFEVGEDTYTLITEANVSGRYCASHVAVDAPDTEQPTVGEDTDRDEIIPGNEELDYDANPYLFELSFAPEGLAQVVDAQLPLATPWRVTMIGDLSSIVESNFVTALNEDQQYDDTSWINPGRASWSWWSDSESPRDLETQKKYIDYAAEQGWEYTLLDRSWRREWMPNLVEYANEHGVDLITWHVWYDLNTEAKRETILSRLKSWGISGVKVDYMDSDRQQRMEFYDEILEATAEHELMINFHGSTVPKGRRRTWPHLMTSEAVRGAEYYKFGTITPSHNVILPYTRNVVGPMDYTPVTFSATDQPPETTPGHELALSVVYQSDWQHFADSVETYRNYPLAEWFLSRVAAVWDDSIFVNGQPASEATIARRSGEEWFVGSIIAGGARTIDIPLTFLGDDNQYNAVIIHDGDNALARERSVVGSSGTISVDIPENGGASVYLTPR